MAEMRLRPAAQLLCACLRTSQQRVLTRNKGKSRASRHFLHTSMGNSQGEAAVIAQQVPQQYEQDVSTFGNDSVDVSQDLTSVVASTSRDGATPAAGLPNFDNAIAEDESVIARRRRMLLSESHRNQTFIVLEVWLF